MKDEEKFLLTGLGLGPEKAEAEFFFGPGLGLVGLATPIQIRGIGVKKTQKEQKRYGAD